MTAQLEDFITKHRAQLNPECQAELRGLWVQADSERQMFKTIFDSISAAVLREAALAVTQYELLVKMGQVLYAARTLLLNHQDLSGKDVDNLAAALQACGCGLESKVLHEQQ